MWLSKKKFNKIRIINEIYNIKKVRIMQIKTLKVIRKIEKNK
jgi:hypothetical protein